MFQNRPQLTDQNFADVFTVDGEFLKAGQMLHLPLFQWQIIGVLDDQKGH